MKITRRDLDPTIIEKLDQFDSVKEAFNENIPDGYVAYGKKGFYLKRVNDALLRRIYFEDDIVSLENGLYNQKDNIRSSSFEDLSLDNKLHIATHNLLHKIQYEKEDQLENEIIFTKSFQDCFLVYTDDGNIRIYSLKGIVKYNIIEKLCSTFNLSNRLNIYDVVDIAQLEENKYIIATNIYGVYSINLTEDTIEMLFATENIRKIELARNDLLFVAADTACSFYDIKSGKCIERYYNLVNKHEIPLKVLNVNGDIFVVGMPTGIQNLDNILHYWKLDPAGISYNLCDGKVAKNPINNKYQVLFANQDDDNIYLAGLYLNRVFIWKYNITTLRMKEEIIEDLFIDTFDGFLGTPKGFLLLSGNKIFLVKDSHVLERGLLRDKCKSLKEGYNGILSISDNKIIKFALGTFNTEDTVLSYSILDDDVDCNNIDIFVKGASENERIKLFNSETREEIKPTFYMIYKGNAVIKILNCEACKIDMDISVTKQSNIEGIVIKKNRMFLR